MADAKVRWMEQAWPSARTDANGTFKLESSRNWHLLYFGHASVPNHARHSYYLFVTHPNYSVYSFKTYSGGEFGRISLERSGGAQKAKNLEAVQESIRAEEASREQMMRAADQTARDAARKAVEDAQKRSQ